MADAQRISKLQPHAQMCVLAAAGVACLLLAPNLARAQAIGGTVTDATGAVLPGVTVEARSPALIEQVRTAVTDGSGQYLIVALEPGEYSVTFSLPGFSSLVRQGVELSTGFTANVGAQLTIGALEETVTVTEATPVIDVQNVAQRETIDRDVYEVIPTARSYDSMALLIPAMNTEAGSTTSLTVDSGGVAGRSSVRLRIHGSTAADATAEIDGLDTNQVTFEGVPDNVPFDGALQEFDFQYSASSAEVETGGVRLNMIPREGANTFSGAVFADLAPDSSWMANNIDQELIDRGIMGGEQGGVGLDQAWYIAPSFGGPIARDRLWFWVSGARRRGSIFPANIFDNSDTSALVFVPDTDRPTKDRQDMYEATLRLTWQATEKDKVRALWFNSGSTHVPSLSGSQLDPLFIAPEAGSELAIAPNTYQLSWVRPQTNRLLFEAAVGMRPSRAPLLPLDAASQSIRGTGREELDARVDLPSVFEASTLTMFRNYGFFFGGTDVHFSTANNSYRASMSYVTGSHNFKLGVNGTLKRRSTTYASHNNWTNVTTLLGLPLQAQFSARASLLDEDAHALGVYAQDQWTVDRLTVNAGVRFDYFEGSYPDHTLAPTTWVPFERTYPGATAVSWKDLQPRLGVVYDLRGDGRTAVKASISRYGERNGTLVAGQLNPGGSNTEQQRLWFDGAPGHPFAGVPPVFPPCIPSAADPTGASCVPGDGLPQGDPLDPNPNGELLSPNTLLAFGTPVQTTFYDSDWAFGWGNKHSNWELSAGLQHELVQSVSVDVAYFRRAFVNFSVRENRAVSAEDYDSYTITAPADPRLPGGGGYPLTLFDLKPDAIRVQENVTTSADPYGGESRTWQGIDATVAARLDAALIQGGISAGTTSSDYCALQTSVPEVFLDALRIGGVADSRGTTIATDFCGTETPWLTQVSVSGSYSFPYDISVSGAFFSRPGPERLAVYRVPLSEAIAALGRVPTTRGGAVSVNILEPGAEYADRLNQFDLRVGKVIQLGGTANLRASFDVYNLFNANAVSRERYGFTPGVAEGWLVPVGLQPGRLAKVAFQLNF